MVRIQHSSIDGQNDDEQAHPERSAAELEEQLLAEARGLAAFARDPRAGQDEVTLRWFEKALILRVFAIGRLAVELFLRCAEQRVRDRTPSWLVCAGRRFQKTRARPRRLTTWFGRVSYWRTYLAEAGAAQGHGYYPLDVNLGLTADRLSLGVLSVVVRLATTLSFARAKATAELFLPEVPATQVIEKATLGLGRFTQQWFEQAPPPQDDGEVLVIMVDSKGAPQVTEQEMRRRRRPWKNRPRAASPRHRTREKRGRHGSKKRRKKGDKSKNAKMATVVVMYTLRSVGTEHHGPINPWYYASL